MFDFAHPLYFLLLLPLAAAGWFVFRRRPGRGLLFSCVSRLPPECATWRTRAANLLPVLFFAGLLLTILALARPRTIFSRSRRTADVIAIQMVVDVSGSMEALDLSDIANNRILKERTRLTAVKEVFAEFIRKRPDDLIGLITFGGYATTRSPLTMDHNALLHVLSGVEIPKQVLNQSGGVRNAEELMTAVGDALATACARLEQTEPTTKIVVLLSDGESNTGIIQPQEALKLASKMGIRIYTIGVGSTGQAPFRGRDMFGRSVIAYGEVRMDEELLIELATKTGGEYFNVRDPKGLEESMEKINRLETTRVESDVYNQYNEWFPWFLVPAILLILAGVMPNMVIAKRIV